MFSGKSRLTLHTIVVLPVLVLTTVGIAIGAIFTPQYSSELNKQNVRH
jgi:hypothetical protein